MYLIHEFHNVSWITEINELFHDILIYWDAPVSVLICVLSAYFVFVCTVFAQCQKDPHLMITVFPRTPSHLLAAKGKLSYLLKNVID